jgi:uncharacterized alpha/beta hydrolase family protein
MLTIYNRQEQAMLRVIAKLYQMFNSCQVTKIGHSEGAVSLILKYRSVYSTTLYY